MGEGIEGVVEGGLVLVDAEADAEVDMVRDIGEDSRSASNRILINGISYIVAFAVVELCLLILRFCEGLELVMRGHGKVAVLISQTNQINLPH